MVNEKITNILSSMTNDPNINFRVINRVFNDLYYVDEENQTLLHLFLSDKYEEKGTIQAIKALLKCGKLDPNLKDNYGYNFIQTALLSGYSEDFILELISVSISNFERPLNVNTFDCNGNTIVHTAINSDKYIGDIIGIYSQLCNYGFDSRRINNYGENLINAIMDKKDKYKEEEINKFKEVFYNRILESELEEYQNDNSQNYNIMSSDDINKIEKIGKILNFKKYSSYPVVGREKELESLIVSLASCSISPLIVGENGVGKTVLIDELMYRIINDQVPDFLKNKIVIEVNPSQLVAGTKYAGTFEERIKLLMEMCIKYDAILFVDKIHRTFGTGTHDNSKVDMASMLIPYIEREGVKVIGTTTFNEYNDFFYDGDLKDKFEIIKISEPDYDTLYKIIEKTILDYSMKTNISSYDILKNNNIIDLLIEFTNVKHRVYNDRINNPKLVISIIDKTFAYAKVDNSKELKIEHFINSLNTCDRVYPTAREKVINNLNGSDCKKYCKVLKLEDYRKNNYKK